MTAGFETESKDPPFGTRFDPYLLTTICPMPRQELRSLIAGDPFVAADCYSALTARIVEHVGFPAAYMGGHATGMMHYAIPDNGILTPTEMVEQAGVAVSTSRTNRLRSTRPSTVRWSRSPTCRPE